MTSLYDIDLVGPETVLAVLGIDEATLLDLVNQDRLPAYRIGAAVRFRAIEVANLTAQLAA